VPEVEVTLNEDRRRWEAWVDGELAGKSYFRREGDVVRFTHTEVDDRFEGRGVGGALARTALDDVAAAGGRVRPDCPFVRAWIGRHPDYQRLVD
jgi:predicted GNAT family acetyltransferase